MIDRALIIDTPWIDRILRGEKVWEMRSRRTSIRGTVGLIRKGSKTIVGVADLAGCGTPLNEAQLAAEFEKHRIPPAVYADPQVRKWNVPWHMAKVRKLPRPVPYGHVNGQVTWVTITPGIARAVYSALNDQK